MGKLNTLFEFNLSTKTIVGCNGVFFIDCLLSEFDCGAIEYVLKRKAEHLRNSVKEDE